MCSYDYHNPTKLLYENIFNGKKKSWICMAPVFKSGDLNAGFYALLPKH